VTSECEAVVLAKDAADRLAATLSSLTAAGLPVVVIDSGSVDDTVAVAEKGGARVLHRALDNFSAQRNWAMDQVDAPYVLFVDSDELVTSELAAEVRAAVRANVDGAWIPTLDYFAGRWLLHGIAYPQPHLRLLKRSSSRFRGAVHETVTFSVDRPEIARLRHPLLHVSHTTISRYLAKMDRYTDIEAGEREGRPWRLIGRGAGEAVAVFARGMSRGAWRDGVQGVAHTALYSFYRFTIGAKAAVAASHADQPTASDAMGRWRRQRGNRRGTPTV
jgi:glycosyltransferase involved in cell wall biosynthesis